MKQEIIQRLRGLSESPDVRPAWAILKDCIEEIDVAIAAGVKIQAIEKSLAELGLDLAPTALRSALYRYRKKRRNQEPAPSFVRASSSRPQPPDPNESSDSIQTRKAPPPPEEMKEAAPASSNPFAYRSQLSPEEKEHLNSLSPTEKIDYFRQQAQRRKFTHNPTPERFRKEGE